MGVPLEVTDCRLSTSVPPVPQVDGLWPEGAPAGGAMIMDAPWTSLTKLEDTIWASLEPVMRPETLP